MLAKSCLFLQISIIWSRVCAYIMNVKSTIHSLFQLWFGLYLLLGPLADIFSTVFTSLLLKLKLYFPHLRMWFIFNETVSVSTLRQQFGEEGFEGRSKAQVKCHMRATSLTYCGGRYQAILPHPTETHIRLQFSSFVMHIPVLGSF